jgi:hypothetical protein
LNDSPGPLILPAGAAPGVEPASGERAPDGVLYFRIYAGLLSVVSGFMVVAGGGMLVAPLVLDPAAVTSAGAEPYFYLAAIVYGAVGLVFLLPALVALFGGRKPWVHTVGTLVIGLGMVWMCSLPILVPLLIVWQRAETKRWYGI